MPSVDYAWVEIEGRRLEHWTSYSIDSDLTTPADGWRFSVGLPNARTTSERALRAELVDLCRIGRGVQIFVGDDSSEQGRRAALQLTGHIDDATMNAIEGQGTIFELEGRDKALHIVDASVPVDCFRVSSVQRSRLIAPSGPGFGTVAQGTAPLTAAQFTRVPEALSPNVPEWYVEQRSLTLGQLATLLCEPYSIQVVFDQTACRDILTGRMRGDQASRAQRAGLRAGSYASGFAPEDVKSIQVGEARPNPGETVWDYLERHAKRLGCLLWFSADGRLIIGSPQYDQPPRARLVRRLRSDPSDPNNIVGGEVKRSLGDRYSRVVVYGKSGRDVSKSKIVGTAVDPDWPADYDKPLVVHDRTITTEEQANRRAQRELAKHKRSAVTMKYDVAGHSSEIGGASYVFAIDTMVEVLDEVGGISGAFYCIKRTLSRDRQKGTTATLVLVPKDSIVL